MIKVDLFENLRRHTATVGVIGIGCVGLPLAVELARARLQTIGIDIDRERVEQVQAGGSYVPDVADEVVTATPWVRRGRFPAATGYGALRDADALSICGPTP